MSKNVIFCYICYKLSITYFCLFVKYFLPILILFQLIHVHLFKKIVFGKVKIQKLFLFYNFDVRSPIIPNSGFSGVPTIEILSSKTLKNSQDVSGRSVHA